MASAARQGMPSSVARGAHISGLRLFVLLVSVWVSGHGWREDGARFSRTGEESEGEGEREGKTYRSYSLARRFFLSSSHSLRRSR